MRIATPEIVWHGGEKGQNDPLLSCDIHPSGVLATGGADSDVRMWKLNLQLNNVNTSNLDEKQSDHANSTTSSSQPPQNQGHGLNKLQEYLYSLEGHERSVNCVRFSPDGQHLGTASDGGRVVLFSLPPNKSIRLWLKSKTCPKQLQKSHLRSTQEDIYDLCWSPNSEYFMTGSVDNQVCVWDMETSTCTHWPAVTSITPPSFQLSAAPVPTFNLIRCSSAFPSRKRRNPWLLSSALSPTTNIPSLSGVGFTLYQKAALNSVLLSPSIGKVR